MAKKNILLFSDTFNINDCDKDGKKFDRVSRFVGRGESLEMELIIDVNTDLYPLDIGDRVNVILTTSLALDPSKAQSEDMITGATSAEEMTQKASWREKSSTERDLSDEYEYVMYGKVYKYDEERRSKVAVYISYGGLLMSLEGDFRHVQNIHVGQQVYLLMKRVQ